MKCRKSAKIISILLVLIMVTGLMAVLIPIENAAASENVSWLDGYQVTSVNDEGTNTLGDEHFAGTAADDGKVWVDKSVSSGTVYGATASDKNFNVVLSAVAQSYSTPNIEFTTYKREVAYDVVLVLDISSSMKNNRLQIMTDAVNATIKELMQNENNRVAIVMYPTVSTQTPPKAKPFRYEAGTFLPMGHYDTENADGDYISANTKAKEATDQYIELCTKEAGDGKPSQVYTKSSEGKESLTNKIQKIQVGTPTQLGLNAVYEEFQSAIENEDPKVGSVPRVPATILLTDGKPVRSWENYEKITCEGVETYDGVEDPVLGEHTYAEDTDPEEFHEQNSTVAYNTIMTANHVKRKIQDLYNDKYNGNGLDLYEKAITGYQKSSIGQMFTIGMEIGQYEWASYVMNPTDDKLDSKWDNTSVPLIQEKLRQGAYKENYSYSDKYLRGEGLSADDLTAMFKEILGEMVQETNDYTVHNPIDSAGSVFADKQNVTFTDYLGYKMELKGDKQYVRYNSVNYTFSVTEATKNDKNKKEYTWDGTDISGNRVASPAVFVQEKQEDGSVKEKAFSLYDIKLTAQKDEDLEINGQKGYWKITWTIPSPLLPTYDREEGFSTTRPIRMLCEVGLEENTRPIEDALKITADGKLASTKDDTNKYAFYTNLYDFGEEKEYSSVNFKPAKDNPYYYKTGYTTEPSSEDATKYVEVDFITNRTQNLTVSGQASDIKLEDLKYNAKGENRNFSFTYNGKTYSGDLSSIEAVEDGLQRYSGTVDIPVTWKHDETTAVESKATVKIIIGVDDDNKVVLRTLTVNDKVYSSTETDTYSFDSVPVSGVGGTTDGKVLTTTYTELHQGKYTDTDGVEHEGYYIEDALNNKIKVAVTLDENNQSSCTINLGGETQKSDIYYKVENKSSYPDAGKNFYKGHEAKVYDSSVVIGLNEENKPVGKYYSSEKNDQAAASYDLQIEKIEHTGVDDYYKATASLKSPAGKSMDMKFIFRLIKVGDKYAVSMVDAKSDIDEAGFTDNGLTWSDFPVLEKAADGKDQYRIDISYILSPEYDKDLNSKANVTQSSNEYFEGSFDLGTGIMTALLGNNGRLSILADDTLAAFKATKTWKDASGNDELPAEISVDLIQVWTDLDGTEKRYTLYEDQKITKDEGWQKTWTSLPKYAITAGGEYILGNDKKPIEVSYTVQEKGSTGGWTSTGTPEAAKNQVTLTNTKTVADKLSLEKIWDDESYTALQDKSNWEIEAQLYAGTDPNDMKPYNKAIVQEDPGFIWAELGGVLQQNDDSEGQATLTVHYGKDETANDNSVSWSETVKVKIDPETGEITLPEDQKTFTFESDPGWSIGQQGHNNYANKLKVEITLSDSTSDQLIKISDVKTTYYYNDQPYHLTNNPLKSINQQSGTSENLGVSGKGMNQYVMSYISGGLTATLDKANRWQHEWSAEEISFPATDADGKPMYYQFRETAIIIDGHRYAVNDKGFITVESGDKAYQYKVINSDPSTAPTNDGVFAFNITNDDDSIDKSVEKIWKGTPPDGTNPSALEATVQLQKKVNGNWEDVRSEQTLKASKDPADSETCKWTYKWENLPKYDSSGAEIEYQVIEKSCTPGYQQSGKPVVSGDKTTITNVRTGKTSLTATKIWQDAGDNSKRPESIELHLMRAVQGEKFDDTIDGQKPSSNQVDVKTIKATDCQVSDGGFTWQYTWNDMPLFDENGDPYEYKIIEKRINAGTYQVPTYSDDQMTVYNTLKPGTTSVRFEKNWIDGGQANRPEITVQLQKQNPQGEWVNEGDPVKIASPATSHTWDKLAKFDNKGNQIQYRVVETAIGSGGAVQYEAVPEGGKIADKPDADGKYVIDNKRADIEDQTQKINVRKNWIDGGVEKARADIKVQLYADGKAVSEADGGSKTLTKENGWRASWENLSRYNQTTGAEIKYTVQETEIPQGYVGDKTTTDADGTIVLNNRLASIDLDEKTALSIEKRWKDDSAAVRPDHIELAVTSTGNGKTETKTYSTDDPAVSVDKTDAGTWQIKISDLPKYDENGYAYSYQVEEKPVAGYDTSSVKDNGNNRWIITNTRTGNVTSFSGEKIWHDAAKQGERPTSITVGLYRAIAGGTPQKVEEKTVTDKNNWEFTFDKEYEQYDPDGKPYTYSVKEEGETGGTAVYGGNRYQVEYHKNYDEFVIENTLYAEYGPAKVTKIWEDDDNSQGKRPDSLEVTLKQNNAVKETLTLTADNALENDSNSWSKNFKGTYPVYDANGERYEYTVEEAAITDYTLKSVTGNITDGFVLTNTYQPGNMTITVSKIWADDGNKLNTRPENGKLTLKLVRSDGNTQDITVEAPAWSKTVDVPSVDENGKAYTYKVEEPDSAITGTDYVKSEDGLTVTNTLSGKVSVSGTKTWADDGNKHKLRPESIKVSLVCDNEIIDSADVKADSAGNWSYAFNDLPKYDENGKLLEYSVSEEPVKYYDASIDGYDITNTLDKSKIPEDPQNPEDPKDPGDSDKPVNADDAGVPEGSVNGTKTGDRMPMAVCIFFCIAALAGAAAVFATGRRHN